MILDSAKVDRINYGAEEGKYRVRVSFKNEKGSVDLILSDELSNSLIRVVGDAVVKYSADAANELHKSFAAAVVPRLPSPA